MRAVAQILVLVAASAGLVVTAGASPVAANAGYGFVGCDDGGCDADASNRQREDANGSKVADSDVTCIHRPLSIGDHEVYLPNGQLVEPDGTGEWFERICSRNGMEVSRRAEYLFGTSPAELRQQARERLVFPVLPAVLNPRTEQTVNFRTLLWIERSQWTPVSATAAVPGVVVTVTATPTRVTWSMGNGDAVECNGPGAPYDPNKSEAEQDTSCSYVYRHSSAGQPDDVYRLTTTVHWSLSWSVTGAPGGGSLGVASRTSAPVDVRVVEVQAVNTSPGGH